MSKDVSSSIDPATLPDDPAWLKRLLFEHQQLLQQRDTLIERIREEAASQLEARRVQLEAEKPAEIAAILRRYYGPKSERFDPRQLLLFGEQVEQQAAQDPRTSAAEMPEEASRPWPRRVVQSACSRWVCRIREAVQAGERFLQTDSRSGRSMESSRPMPYLQKRCYVRMMRLSASACKFSVRISYLPF